MTKKSIRILSHLLFWIFILAFFTFIYGIRRDNFVEIFKVMLGTLPIDILYTYLLIYILIPMLLLKKRYVWFIITFILSFTFVVILEWTINYFILYPSIYADYYKWKDSITYFSGTGLMIYISLGFVILLASAIKLSRYWLQSQQDKANLEIQNRKSELALLRSQVNPHFLFNTLNNIDSLIYKDQDKASDTIVKLSEIMRYFIYETDSDKVPLEKEIDYLHSFIELQRIRHKDPGFIRFQVSGSPTGKLIAPMLFIPFVENAFKHGIKGKKTPAITVDLLIQPTMLRFEVINFIDSRSDQVKDAGKGIGLANVKRRLDLIYPQKYSLSIEKTGEQYNVLLEINLL
ncbi:MAG: histidine kinase [Bacteroidales bacterium]|nr:histidine kinase [Bacteroidota bacterium]MBL6949384.1 histidine kinase [Bacteroidales bacterium]